MSPVSHKNLENSLFRNKTFHKQPSKLTVNSSDHPKSRVTCACYCPSPMAVKLSLLLNSSGLIILLPSIRMGVRIFLVKSSGFSFLNSCHSVTMMQQSVSFRQFIAEEAYLILSPKMDLALETATGSYAVTSAPSVRSWFMIGMDLASLMSSVSGLKARPRTAILLPFSSVNFSFAFFNCVFCLVFVNFFDCLEYDGCVVNSVGEDDKWFHVFGKA